MIRFVSPALCGLVLCAATPALADRYGARNDIEVVPTADGFVVTESGGEGARGMWCAAGDYARAQGATAPKQRLYVAEAQKPGGLGRRGAVRFTLDPRGLDPRPVFLIGGSLGQAGSSMAVQHAFSLCRSLQSASR